MRLTRPSAPLSTLLLLGLMAPSLSHAEGSGDLQTTQDLESRTTLYVDILDASVETITWTGASTITVTDPAGKSLGTFTSGRTITPTTAGAYKVTLSTDESAWDLTVNDAIDGGGRVWSYVWYVDTGSYGSSVALNTSVYIMVDGGSSSDTAVIELLLDGFSGYVYQVFANSYGVDDADGRSVINDGTRTLAVEYPIYLNPPSKATYTSLTPSVSAAGFASGALECDTVVSGSSSGEFSFTSTVDGVAHVICDLNNDGVFDFTTDDDLHLLDNISKGASTISWDGLDNTGANIPEGSYDCEVLVTVGEFHQVANDIETSYKGLRMFEVDAAGARTGLDMYWNDSEVQYKAAAMPNGDIGLETSGPNGVNSGSYTAAASPNSNARAWGQFADSGKGNNSLLDTYTFVESDTSATLTVTVVRSTTNSDGDCLTDAEESCEVGSDPTVDDTDGDGLDDCEEVNTTGSDA